VTEQTIATLGSILRAHLHADTDTDTAARAQYRVAVIFTGFYDDEPGEPDQALRDLLTDLVHEADWRGVDIYAALNSAVSMADQERDEWGMAPVQR
jgi:hypothetical protein